MSEQLPVVHCCHGMKQEKKKEGRKKKKKRKKEKKKKKKRENPSLKLNPTMNCQMGFDF